MSAKYFPAIIIFLVNSFCIVSAENRIYENEKAIQFENDGQSIAAFQGTIQVRENRSNPNSRFIPLTYVRFPATGISTGSPIIYLAGGPGGSGISTAQYPGFRFPLFMALREFGDVIALDQRGTGKSKTAPKCTAKQSMPIGKKMDEQKLTQLYRAAAAECVTFWKNQGIDVLGYTSVESAKDIDQLRLHLNADKVTLWGISYGSHLALTAMKTMPGKIDKVVIASAEGLDQTVKLPARTDAYFARLQLAINQQPKAIQAYPNINAMMQRVHSQLRNHPIALKIPQKDGSEVDFLFQYFHMQGIASSMIADPQRGVSRLLGLYRALDNGHTEMLPSIVKRAGFDDDKISFNLMSFGMDIASGMSKKRANMVAEQAKTSLLGNLLNFPMPQLNRAIKGLDLGDDFRKVPSSNVPTLLLTGTLDGRTYPQAQLEATLGLSQLTQVVIENAGHNLFMVSPKVTEVIKAFLKGESIKSNKLKIELPQFIR